MEPAVPRAEVTIYSPLFSPARHALQGEAVSIGRASDCALPIKDRYLSRKHAELVAANGTWLLKDLGSANGTYLNGARVEQDQVLHPGDRIRLGDTEIVFEAQNHTDTLLAIRESAVRPTFAIPLHEIDRPEEQDIARLQTLTQLARELIEDRPMDQLFGFIVDRVMEHLSPSRAAIALLGADGKSFTKVELRRQDESDESELNISHTLLAQMIEEKKAMAFMDVALNEKLSRAKSIIMQGIHSILCAPMIIGNSVVGVLYVDYLFNQREISEEDVRLVAHVARFAATKLETTRLREQAIEKRIIDEELKTASAIQRRLLPPAPTGVPGYTFGAYNQPCRTVSGDYYDFVIRPDGRIYFVIADVSGKGVTAGLMMAGLQVAFRIFSKSDPDPAVLVSQLNGSLREHLPRSKFVTLFLGRLDTATGLIEYVNAGHTPPLFLSGDEVRELSESDLLLGVIPDVAFTTHALQMAPGDSLVLYTDGVTEARNHNDDDLGSDTIAAALRPLHGLDAETIAQSVNQTVLGHVGTDPEALDDDVTLLVVTRSQ